MKCIGFVWNLHMVDHVDFGPENVMESGQLIVQTICFLLSIDQVDGQCLMLFHVTRAMMKTYQELKYQSILHHY